MPSRAFEWILVSANRVVGRQAPAALRRGRGVQSCQSVRMVILLGSLGFRARWTPTAFDDFSALCVPLVPVGTPQSVTRLQAGKDALDEFSAPSSLVSFTPVPLAVCCAEWAKDWVTARSD